MTPPLLPRRRFLQAAAVAASCTAVAGLCAESPPERARLQLAVGGKASFYYLPLTIAEQLGFFEAEGLELEISDFAGGARAMQALAGGTAQVVAGAYEHTIHLQSRNQWVRSIVMMGRAPAIAIGVSNRTLPGYRSLRDLRGRRIGVSAAGSSTHLSASLVLLRGRVDPSEVSFVDVGTGVGAVAALRSGQIDAICNVDPVMTMLEQKSEVRIVSDTRTLKGSVEVYGGPMPAACLYVPAEFMQKHPATCQALASAIVRSLKWLQTAGPSDIIKTVPQAYMLGDRALYLASFNKIREAIALDGVMPEEGPRTALRALASFENGIHADKIDLGKTFSNLFARHAKERFKV